MKNTVRTIISKREFFGEEHYAFLQQQFDASRVYLKNCGKPKDDFDKWLIQEAKWTSQLFKSLLD